MMVKNVMKTAAVDMMLFAILAAESCSRTERFRRLLSIDGACSLSTHVNHPLGRVTDRLPPSGGCLCREVMRLPNCSNCCAVASAMITTLIQYKSLKELILYGGVHDVLTFLLCSTAGFVCLVC